MIRDLTEFKIVIAQVAEQTEELREATVRSALKLVFTDGSVLFARENRVRGEDYLDYSYHWQTADHRLIRRWDNAHARHLPGTPAHHQHVGSEENVLASEPMTLEAVLRFIAESLTSN